MRQFKLLVIAALFGGLSAPAFAATPTVGTGSATTFIGTYHMTPISLTDGQSSGSFALDNQGRLEISPLYLQTTTGIGNDTIMPTEAGITSNFTSAQATYLGWVPNGATAIVLHIPPGASVTGYVATSGTGFTSLSAALPYSTTYANPTGAVSSLDVTIPLNATTNNVFYVTNVVTGTTGTYTTGLPTYRWI